MASPVFILDIEANIVCQNTKINLTARQIYIFLYFKVLFVQSKEKNDLLSESESGC